MIGKTISHYRIIEKLGEGGMGVVYRAEDTTLGREVALKFLSPACAGTEEQRARFVREARTAAALNHPSICTIHEISGEEGGFIAMELVEGESLREKLADGPMNPSEALAVVLQVAEGLKEAHGRGIVHRDIKPANIMLTADGRVKIMDFGLATLCEVSDLTAGGKTLGTVAYMSPEQTRGETVDHRTDIWSLGVMLYEMLSGERPFRGHYDQAVVYSILNEDPPPLTHAVDVPAALAQTVERMLAKDPADRLPDDDTLIAELKAARDGGEDPASGTAAAKPVPSIAVMPFVDMSPGKDQEFFCDGMSEEIINALTKIDGLRVIARTSAFAFKGKNEDIREIGKALDVSTIVEGSVRKAGNRLRITAQLITVADGTHAWSERYDRELEDVFAIQDEIATAIAERLKSDLTPGERKRLANPRKASPEAYQEYLRGRHYLSRHFLDILFKEPSRKKAIGFFERAIDADPAFAEAHAGLADVLSLACRYSGETEYGEQARAAARRALDLDESNAEAHKAIANVYFSVDLDWESAEQEYRKAIELNPGSPDAHESYGMQLVWCGSFDQGLEEIRLSLSLDPFDYGANLALAAGLLFARRYEESLAQLEAMRDLFPDDNTIDRFVASCHVRMGIHLDEAIETMERLGSIGVALTTAYVAAGRRQDALDLTTEYAERGGRRDIYHAALGHAALGDGEKALDWLEKTYERSPEQLRVVNSDLEFDFLRPHPRFRALMRKAHIPSGQLEDLSR